MAGKAVSTRVDTGGRRRFTIAEKKKIVEQYYTAEGSGKELLSSLVYKVF